MTKLRARFFAPPVELAGCFTSIYLLEVTLEAGTRVEDFLHPEWGGLRFFLGGLPETQCRDGTWLTDTPFTATGPSSCPLRFRLPTTRMWGLGLLPLGWARFMNEPAAALADAVCDGTRHPAYTRFAPLCEALRSREGGDEEQAAIIADFFLALDRPVRDGTRIAAVHEALIDPALRGAADLADRTNMTQRTLERLCARYFGFTPQLLIRRQRMMRTLSAFMLADRGQWSQVIDVNYTDHAHFTHEFHAFMRMSPRDYASLDHPILSAFLAERARVLGSPVQTLDPPVRPTMPSPRGDGAGSGAEALR
jgi:AraC-like DNA-binding protein